MKSSPPELNSPLSRGARIAYSMLAIIGLLVSGFVGGVAVERFFLDNDNRPFADLEAVSRIIDENYYYQPTSDDERAQMDAEMEAGAIQGAIETLDDGYTVYLDADESLTAQEGLEGRYGGVGIDVVVDDGVAFVAAVVPDSPADRAGITRGDVIEQVNGELVLGYETNDVTRMLRGNIGDPISLIVIRPTTGNVEEYQLSLEEIVLPPVSLSFFEDGSIAWLRITLFGTDTVPELDKAIAEIRASNATGVILDLRGNGGGWVEAARQTLGRFIDPSVGPAMYEDTQHGDGGMTPMAIETEDGIVPLDLPMVVLVDGGTASASEIVAGALKDYNRALIVGEPTFGKGSVQRIFQFSDGSTMRVTVAEWFTPSRGRIQDEGIRPNLEVLPADRAADQDPVLDAGIVVLQNIEPGESPIGSPIATPTS